MSEGRKGKELNSHVLQVHARAGNFRVSDDGTIPISSERERETACFDTG